MKVKSREPYNCLEETKEPCEKVTHFLPIKKRAWRVQAIYTHGSISTRQHTRQGREKVENKGLHKEQRISLALAFASSLSVIPGLIYSVAI